MGARHPVDVVVVVLWLYRSNLAKQICVQARMYIYTYVHIYVYIFMYIFLHVCMHVYTLIYVYRCIFVRKYM